MNFKNTTIGLNFNYIVNSIIANESSGEWVAVPRNGPSLLRQNEEHAHQERMPFQVFRIQGKETNKDYVKSKDLVEDGNLNEDTATVDGKSDINIFLFC